MACVPLAARTQVATLNWARNLALREVPLGHPSAVTPGLRRALPGSLCSSLRACGTWTLVHHVHG